MNSGESKEYLSNVFCFDIFIEQVLRRMYYIRALYKYQTAS
jgi:hypothetical protein